MAELTPQEVVNAIEAKVDASKEELKSELINDICNMLDEKNAKMTKDITG